MTGANIGNLLGKMGAFGTSALDNAAGLCVSRTHYEVTVEHFLIKALEIGDSDISLILGKCSIDRAMVIAALNRALETMRSGNTGKPVFSILLLELIRNAWMAASVDLGLTRIGTGAVMLALIEMRGFHAIGGWFNAFADLGTDTIMAAFREVGALSCENEDVSPSKQPSATTNADTGGGGEIGAGRNFLERFCENFTDKAADGRIDRVFGRDDEIRRMIDVLARHRKNNPILVGDPGVGKTALVEGLALKINEGDVPDTIGDVAILGLDMGRLKAGAGMKGEFENRLKGVIDEIVSSEKPIILFIDEAHALVDAGGAAGGSDAANLLKPALARGELRVCAATTWGEYKKYFEKDPALARRFQPIRLDEFSNDTTAMVLHGLRDRYEASHGVVIRDNAIRAAAEFAGRHIFDRFQPDKAIDVLDTACARIRVSMSSKPAALEDAETRVKALERECRAIERDRDHGVSVDPERLESIRDNIAENARTAERLATRWRNERERADRVIALRDRIREARASDAPDEAAIAALKDELRRADDDLKTFQGDDPMVFVDVGPDTIARVVSDWTGIPLGKVARDEASLVRDIDAAMKDKIKGQSHALTAIGDVVRAAKAGMTPAGQPLGVFLLAGPSGVGKTETALALADLLFGDEKALVTVNMSEFRESHSMSRLIGSPPGYVGYGEGGVLSEAVRRKPYSVVLLDEAEKAHMDVMNMFHQVFDKGSLSDGEGKDISFRNTIIILTSNLGGGQIARMARDGVEDMERVAAMIHPVLSAHFKPALLARMSVVPYLPLDRRALREIVMLKLDRLERRLWHANKVRLIRGEAVVDRIVSRCRDSETGARDIDAILKRAVLPRLSREILTRMTEAGMPDSVRLDSDEDGNFTLVFGGSNNPETLLNETASGPPRAPERTDKAARGAVA